MTALDDLCKKRQKTQLEWAILVTLEAGGEATAADAAEELASYEHLAAVARDVNKWLNTIDMGGTGHQRSLESALAEYDKCRAA